MDVSNDLQVRWKHHQLGVMEYLRQLLVSEVFVDVTLCCQNKRFRAHRVLLSACSSYLQKLLLEHGTSDHVTIILPDVDPEDMHWLLHFIYTGTVAVPRSRLGSFLQAADSLGVKMLADIQSQEKCDVDSVICCVDLKRDDFKLTKDKRTYTSENIRSQLLGDVFENKIETKDHISGQPTEPNSQKIDTKKEERRTRSLCDSSEPVKHNSAVELSGSLQKCESVKPMDIAHKQPESAICFNQTYCSGRQKECCDARTDINSQAAPIKLISPLQNNSMPCCPRNALDFTDPGAQRNDGNPEVKSSPINPQPNTYSGMLPQCAVRPFVSDKCQQKQHRDEILNHSRNLYAEFHHSEHYSLQHLAQWAKPIPSLMPLANNNYNFNGKFPNVPPSPAFLPGGERPLNGYVTRPNLGGDYGKDDALLPPPPPPQLPGDPRWLHQRLPGQMPRLSPIVPPSPWVQHHRPPCAAPRAYTNSLQHSGGATGGNPGHRIANTAPSGHALQQAFGDPTFHCAATAIHMNTTETTDPAEGQATKLRRHEANEPDIRKRNLGSTETLLCRLKERRLQEFYREQNTEKARDLSTSSSTALPATTQKMPAIPPASFQQKLKHIAELSSPRLPDHRDKLLAVKKEEEDEGSDTRKFTSDDVGSLKTEPNSMNDEENNDEDASNNSSKLTNGVTEVANNKREAEDDEVQILSASAVPPPAYTKNDNNNNGTVTKNHGCEDCGKSFSRRQLLVQHRRIHTGERPYSCADCGRQFTQRGHWSTHQKLHEPSRRPEHACPSCGKAFVTRASLKVHLRTHTGEKPFQCTECGKQFSQLRNYKYHRSVHEGTREFAATCPECGKYFNDRGYLSSHMKIHRNRKEYGCQYCGKSFNQRVAYNMHVRIHTGERPHSCPHCSKSFSRKMLLKQHLRIHTGEKPFACSVCGKAFADRSNMTLHMRLHSGVKPYSCSLCSKAFTKKHHLKTHLNYHTGTKPYSCSKCGLRFSQSSNMRTHYKKCTSTGPPQNSSPEHSVTENTLTANPSLKLNGVSPVVSPGTSSTVGSEVAVSSPRSASASVITPPHSDESSCGSSVISRNGMDVQVV